MERQSGFQGRDESHPPRSYGLPITEGAGVAYPDARGITEDLIRAVVVEFYRRARRDDRLGPVFQSHVQEWENHLDRMTDFWSAALLQTGRYAGNPMVRHHSIDGLSAGLFGRWVELFESTVCELCPPREAQAFLTRALRMRDAMTKVLRLYT
jgi:hemoglobin